MADYTDPLRILGVDKDFVRRQESSLGYLDGKSRQEALNDAVTRMAKSHYEMLAQRFRPDRSWKDKMFLNLPGVLSELIDELASGFHPNPEQASTLATQYGPQVVETVRYRREILLSSELATDAPTARKYVINKDKWSELSRKLASRLEMIEKQAQEWKPVVWAWTELKDVERLAHWIEECLQPVTERFNRAKAERSELKDTLEQVQRSWLEQMRLTAEWSKIERHPAFRHRVLKLHSFNMPPAQFLVVDRLGYNERLLEQKQEVRRPLGGRKFESGPRLPEIPLPHFNLTLDEQGVLTLHELRRVNFDPKKGLPEDAPIFWHLGTAAGKPSTHWKRTGKSEQLPGKIVGSLDVKEMREGLGPAWVPRAALSGQVGTGLAQLIKAYPQNAVLRYLPFYSPWIFEGAHRKSMLLVRHVVEEEVVYRLLEVMFIYVEENPSVA